MDPFAAFLGRQLYPTHIMRMPLPSCSRYLQSQKGLDVLEMMTKRYVFGAGLTTLGLSEHT